MLWTWLITIQWLLTTTTSAERVRDAGTINGMITALSKILSNTNTIKSSSSNPSTTTNIQVFVAGFGRTGTSSLTLALEMLGYRPLHDGDISHVAADVNALYENKITTDQLFSKIASQGYNVTGLDVLNHFWRWAVDKDEVKVILTVRDTPEAWVDSFLSMADHYNYMTVPPLSFLQGITRRFLDDLFLHEPTGGKPTQWRDPIVLKEGYLKRQREVIAEVPSDRLLVFNVKEGWTPLCKFLNKPIPPSSFPRVNDRAFMEGVGTVLWLLTWIWPLLALLPFGFVMCVYVRFLKPKRNQKIIRQQY